MNESHSSEGLVVTIETVNQMELIEVKSDCKV